MVLTSQGKPLLGTKLAFSLVRGIRQGRSHCICEYHAFCCEIGQWSRYFGEILNESSKTLHLSKKASEVSESC